MRKTVKATRSRLRKPPVGKQIAKLALGLLEGLIQIVALLAPRVFGVPDHVVAQFSEGGNVASGSP
jgi:hypothetical protein